MHGLMCRLLEPQVNREFFARLSALLRIMVPAWRSKEFLLLALQALFLCGTCDQLLP